MKDNIITFNPYNWLGNMGNFRIYYCGEEWISVEALFQAMRFNDESIRQKIRKQSISLTSRLNDIEPKELDEDVRCG